MGSKLPGVGREMLLSFTPTKSERLKIAVEDWTHRMHPHIVSIISIAVNSKTINQWSWSRTIMYTCPMNMGSSLLLETLALEGDP